MICRNRVHRCASGGSVERHCAAKSGHHSQVTWQAWIAADCQGVVDSSSVLAFWMQTTGATLLRVRRCGVVRAWMPAEDSRSAYGLLYLAAVRSHRHHL